MFFDVRNWYWTVDDKADQFWGSVPLKFVSATDPTYGAWAQQGNSPTSVPEVNDLAQVMLKLIQPVVMAAGVTLECYSQPSLKGTYSLNDQAISLMTNVITRIAAGRPLPGGGHTFFYTAIDGRQYAFSAAQFQDFNHACLDYMYDWNQALFANLNGSATDYPAPTVTIP